MTSVLSTILNKKTLAVLSHPQGLSLEGSRAPLNEQGQSQQPLGCFSESLTDKQSKSLQLTQASSIPVPACMPIGASGLALQAGEVGSAARKINIFSVLRANSKKITSLPRAGEGNLQTILTAKIASPSSPSTAGLATHNNIENQLESGTISNMLKTYNIQNYLKSDKYYLSKVEYATGSDNFSNKLNKIIRSNVTSKQVKTNNLLGLNLRDMIVSVHKFQSNMIINKIIAYNFNKKVLHTKLNLNINNLLENAFFSLGSLISKPVFEITPNKIVIHLFFYINNSKNRYRSSQLAGAGYFDKQNFIRQLQFLCAYLSKILNKSVEFDLVRLHHVNLESHILANTLGLLGENSRFNFMMDTLFKKIIIRDYKNIKYLANTIKFKNILPSVLLGVKVKLGGRLLKERIIPRLTSKKVQNGTMARGKAQLVTTSRYTTKNTKGTFSFTVSMAHAFY